MGNGKSPIYRIGELTKSRPCCPWGRGGVSTVGSLRGNAEIPGAVQPWCQLHSGIGRLAIVEYVSRGRSAIRGHLTGKRPQAKMAYRLPISKLAGQHRKCPPNWKKKGNCPNWPVTFKSIDRPNAKSHRLLVRCTVCSRWGWKPQPPSSASHILLLSSLVWW